MSRVSRKSDLSPSITKGNGGGIDLGKNSGVDMGRKSTPSVTSGGIGITQEITNVGGVSVSGGASIDISPLDIGINYNPSENLLGIAGGAEIPGGILGASGGITINLNTGEITGGSIGGEALGLGINISFSEEGGLGVGFTLQIPFTPIELELVLGFPPKKEPTPTPTPTPTPGSFDPSIPILPPRIPKPVYPQGSPDKVCTVYFGLHYSVYNWFDFYGAYKITQINFKEFGTWSPGVVTAGRSGKATYNFYNSPAVDYTESYDMALKEVPYDRPIDNDNSNSGPPYYVYVNRYRETRNVAIRGIEANVYAYVENFYTDLEYWGYNNKEYMRIQGYYHILNSDCSDTPDPPTPTPPPPPPPDSSPPPPFPNPPPRRRNKMDDCCRLNLAFLRAIYTRLGLAKFPGKLPNTIIQEVQKEGETPPEPPSVPIPDLTSLLMWQFERDDERWGQWQVEINIKDSDITKEDDQEKQIKFPNLAESIAEFEGQLLSIMTNVDALVALQIKTLAESGMARQESIKAYLASKAIIKYMAFKSTETDIPVPMTFTAGAETISELLKESEGHIKGNTVQLRLCSA